MTPNKINNHFLAYSNILDVSKMCFYSSFIQIDSGKALYCIWLLCLLVLF